MRPADGRKTAPAGTAELRSETTGCPPPPPAGVTQHAVAQPCTQRCGRRPPCEVSRERRRAQGRVCPWPRREPATGLHARSASQPQKCSGGHRDVQAAERAPRPGGEARTPPTCAGHFTTASARTQVSRGPDARMNRQRPIHDAPRSAQTPSRRVKRTQAACSSGVRVTRAMKRGCYTIESTRAAETPRNQSNWQKPVRRSVHAASGNERSPHVPEADEPRSSFRKTRAAEGGREPLPPSARPGSQCQRDWPRFTCPTDATGRWGAPPHAAEPGRREASRDAGAVPCRGRGCRGAAPAAHRP